MSIILFAVFFSTLCMAAAPPGRCTTLHTLAFGQNQTQFCLAQVKHPCYEYRSRISFLRHNLGCNVTAGFDIDHIVDMKHSTLSHCDHNIWGNLILASSKWNRQMGSRCWATVEAEKRAVYGNATVDWAMRNIRHCCQPQLDLLFLLLLALFWLPRVLAWYCLLCSVFRPALSIKVITN